jgi:hypothetical protein
MPGHSVTFPESRQKTHIGIVALAEGPPALFVVRPGDMTGALPVADSMRQRSVTGSIIEATPIRRSELAFLRCGFEPYRLGFDASEAADEQRGVP